MIRTHPYKTGHRVEESSRASGSRDHFAMRFVKSIPYDALLASLLLLAGGCYYHGALAAPAPATDGSYPVARIELVSSGGVTAFRNSVLMRRPTIQHDSPVNAFEVDMRTGLFVLRQTDLFVKDVMPLSFTRTYRPWDTKIHALGMGTSHPYELTEYGTRFPYTYMNIVLEDFDTVHFERISKGTGFADAVYQYTAAGSEFYGARISWNGDGWTLVMRDGSVVVLPEAYNAKTPTQAAVVEMRNAKGQRIRFDREPGTRNLRRLLSPSGHAMLFEYNSSGQVSRATDDLGDEADYFYDSEKRLYAVSRTDGHAYRFAYDRDMITTISDEKGRVLLNISYNEAKRVDEERLADGGVYQYRYVWSSGNDPDQIFVKVPDGTVYGFDHGVPMPKN